MSVSRTLRLHHHLRDVGQDEQRLVGPHLVAHLGLALLGPEEDVLVDDDAGHVGAHLGARELLLGQGQLGWPPPGCGSPRRAMAERFCSRRYGAAGLELARALPVMRRLRLAPGTSPAGGRSCTSASRRRLASSSSSRARDTACGRAVQLLLGDEALGQQRLQVLVGAARLLQVALRVAHRRRRLLLAQAALALVHVGQLQLAALHLLARGGQLLLVLDALQLEVLLRLLEVGLGQGEQRLAAADLLLEGRAVEEEQHVALLHELALRHDGHDLGLVALDGGGVGHRAQGLQRAALHDRDVERRLLRPRRSRRPAGSASRRRQAGGHGESRRPPTAAAAASGRLAGGGHQRAQVLARPVLAAQPGPRLARGASAPPREAARAAPSARATARRRRGSGVLMARSPSPRPACR